MLEIKDNRITIKPKEKFKPQVYAYIDSNYPTYIKVGYTARDKNDEDRLDVLERINEQYGINTPHHSKNLIWFDKAMRSDGSTFTDKDLHRILRKNGYKQIRSENGTLTEFFDCQLNDVIAAYQAVRDNKEFNSERIKDFPMRQEQKEAVEKTYDYFAGEISLGRVPHFLWNCKMRFGKTFTTYQLMKKMSAKKVLILTFKPAVENQWREDLLTHKDFEGYQFSSKNYQPIEKIDRTKPFVCFGSLQDYLGKNDVGGIKEKNKIVFEETWDLIVLDEYHYGAWNERTQKTIDNQILDEIDEKQNKEYQKESGEGGITEKEWNENTLKAYSYLYLSGTPFKALANGDFTEEQIFNWTYTQEQQTKKEEIKLGHLTDETNPYLRLPQMYFFTYQLPEEVTKYVDNYGEVEFSLNKFFEATVNENGVAQFKFEREVEAFLDIIRGRVSIKNNNDLTSKEPDVLPFTDVFRDTCNHQMWILPSIASCDAMENLLNKHNWFSQGRTIINCSGTKAGVGVKAMEKVLEKLQTNPYSSNKGSIILSCGKLTTGVTMPFLTAILMLSNCSSPETYFQTAFRVQSPWVSKDENGKNKILKKECFVFDFAPTRVLSMMVDYANDLDVDNTKTIVQKVKDFIEFLPVLQYDGFSFDMASAESIVEFVDNGMTSTLLAKKWSSNDLFDISISVLEDIENNPELLAIFDKIQGWRRIDNGVKDDLQIIIQKSDKIKEIKNKKDTITKEEKKELDDSKKEVQSRKKRILEKLKQFVRRIPLFMYLSEYREQTLVDVITKLEPDLFKEVTGLTVDEFKMLKEQTALFNETKLNSAVLKFKTFEDKSLKYTGIDKHEDENIGLYNTVISKEEAKNF